MSDEKYYLEAKKEITNGTKDSALWSKAMALAEGDEAKAHYEYIKFRVEQLNNVNIASEEAVSNKAKEKYWDLFIVAILVGFISAAINGEVIFSSGGVGFAFGFGLGLLALSYVIGLIPYGAVWLIKKEKAPSKKNFIWVTFVLFSASVIYAANI